MPQVLRFFFFLGAGVVGSDTGIGPRLSTPVPMPRAQVPHISLDHYVAPSPDLQASNTLQYAAEAG